MMESGERKAGGCKGGAFHPSFPIPKEVFYEGWKWTTEYGKRSNGLTLQQWETEAGDDGLSGSQGGSVQGQAAKRRVESLPLEQVGQLD